MYLRMYVNVSLYEGLLLHVLVKSERRKLHTVKSFVRTYDYEFEKVKQFPELLQL